jgi:MYXO-CTERM domain-containing protein
MNSTVLQSIVWVLALGALVLYWQRRKKRRSDY